MRDSLGPSWMDNFESFDRLPFAAASIGQVHSGVLKAAVFGMIHSTNQTYSQWLQHPSVKLGQYVDMPLKP